MISPRRRESKLLLTIRSRVLRLCRRRGLLNDEEELAPQLDESEQTLFPPLCAASIQGRVALGAEAGSRVTRLGRPIVEGAGGAVAIKELCAELDGFTLHAAVRVAERNVIERILEHLGLESVLPGPAPARASPQLELVF